MATTDRGAHGALEAIRSHPDTYMRRAAVGGAIQILRVRKLGATAKGFAPKIGASDAELEEIELGDFEFNERTEELFQNIAQALDSDWAEIERLADTFPDKKDSEWWARAKKQVDES